MPGRLKLIVAILLTVVLLLVGAVFFLPGDDTPDVENSNWSLQGEWIVFSCAPSGLEAKSSLYLVRPDGSGVTRLTTDNVSASFPSWAPDGKEIVFQTNSTLHTLRRGAKRLNSLTITGQPDSNSGLPAWSPDGQWIAFVINYLPDQRAALFRVNADGSVLEVVISATRIGSLNWSPDGQWIAYRSIRDSYDAGVRAVRIDGSEERDLIGSAYSDPTWSPSGDLIAVAGADGISVFRQDGSQPTQIADLPAADAEPAWSPDGQWVVFSNYAGDYAQLFKVRVDGSELQQITDMDCSALGPDWIRMPGSS